MRNNKNNSSEVSASPGLERGPKQIVDGLTSARVNVPPHKGRRKAHVAIQNLRDNAR